MLHCRPLWLRCTCKLRLVLVMSWVRKSVLSGIVHTQSCRLLFSCGDVLKRVFSSLLTTLTISHTTDKPCACSLFPANVSFTISSVSSGHKHYLRLLPLSIEQPLSCLSIVDLNCAWCFIVSVWSLSSQWEPVCVSQLC